MQRRIQSMMFAATCVAVLASSHMVRAQDAQDVNNAIMSMPSVDDLRAAQHAPIQQAPPLASTVSSSADLEIIKDILAQPDDRIDLAQVEIAIERMISPQINEMATLHQLDVLAANARARFPQGDALTPESHDAAICSIFSRVGASSKPGVIHQC